MTQRSSRRGSRYVLSSEEKAHAAAREKERQAFISTLPHALPASKGGSGVTEEISGSVYEEQPFLMSDGEGGTYAVSQAEADVEISKGAVTPKAGKNLMILGAAGVAVVGLGLGLWWMNR